MTTEEPRPAEISPNTFDDEPLHEVVNGRRIGRHLGGPYAGVIASDLLVMLGRHSKDRGQGQAVAHALFRIRTVPDLQRRPDLAFLSFERWPRGKRTPNTEQWDVVPDLVVEVVSPTNLVEEIPTRVREYFEAGVRRAWVVYPHESLVYEYDSPRSIRVLGRGDALEGGDVVPGFRLALAELFEEDEPA